MTEIWREKGAKVQEGEVGLLRWENEVGVRKEAEEEAEVEIEEIIKGIEDIDRPLQKWEFLFFLGLDFRIFIVVHFLQVW